MKEIEYLWSSLSIKRVNCHNDPAPENFLQIQEQIKAIDWEYSGNNDANWDLAYLSKEAGFDSEEDVHLLETYYEHIDPFNHSCFIIYKAIVDYWVGLWARMQITGGNLAVGLDKLLNLEKERIENCKKYLQSEEFKKAVNYIKSIKEGN